MVNISKSEWILHKAFVIVPYIKIFQFSSEKHFNKYDPEDRML